MTVETAHLGKGISFPLQISKKGVTKRGIRLSEGEEKVIKAIRLILATPIGSRPIRRDFGSRLHEIPFEPIEEAGSIARDFVIDAIVNWERRVIIIDVDVIENPNNDARLDIQITIQFIKTQRVGNLVFPFFLNDLDEAVIGEGSVVNIFGAGV